MGKEGYHEPVSELNDNTKHMHRALTSLIEELEAIDWYNQRVSVCKDKELRAILEHNRDEEKEHAAMILEWIIAGHAGIPFEPGYENRRTL